MLNIRVANRLTLLTSLFFFVNCFSKIDEKNQSFQKPLSDFFQNTTHDNSITDLEKDKKATNFLQAIVAYKQKLHNQFYKNLELLYPKVITIDGTAEEKIFINQLSISGTNSGKSNSSTSIGSVSVFDKPISKVEVSTTGNSSQADNSRTTNTTTSTTNKTSSDSYHKNDDSQAEEQRQKRKKAEEAEQIKKEEENKKAKIKRDEEEKIQKAAEQARIKKEKKEKEIIQAKKDLISRHGYVYKTPEKLSKEILNAHHETKQASNAYYSVWVDWSGDLYKALKTAKSKEENLTTQAFNLQKEWEEQTLTQIQEISKQNFEKILRKRNEKKVIESLIAKKFYSLKPAYVGEKNEIDTTSKACEEIFVMIALTIAQGNTLWKFADIPDACKKLSRNNKTEEKNQNIDFNKNDFNNNFNNFNNNFNNDYWIRNNNFDHLHDKPKGLKFTVTPYQQNNRLSPNEIDRLLIANNNIKQLKIAQAEKERKKQLYLEKASFLPDKTVLPFQPKLDQNGEKAISKHGDLLDTKGNRWKLDKEKKEWKVYNPSNKLIYTIPAKNKGEVSTQLPKKSTELPKEKDTPKKIATDSENIKIVHNAEDAHNNVITQDQVSTSMNNEEKKDDKDDEDKNDFTEKKKHPVVEQKNTKSVSSSQSTYPENSYTSHTKKESSPLDFQSKQSQRKNQIMHEQNAWKESQNLDSVDPNQIAMIDAIHAIILDAKNSITVELGQASLQAWSNAQNANNFDEYDSYIKKSEKLFTQLENHHKSSTPYVEQKQKIALQQVDNLLKQTKTTLQYQEQNKDSSKIKGQTEFSDYTNRLKNRIQALEETKEKLRSGKLEHHSYNVSNDVLNFMIANNLNYAAFDGGTFTPFQHCLTQEILQVLESSVDMQKQYGFQQKTADLARYNCQLAVSAQQLNQLSYIDEAVALTDLTHFFEMYGRSMLNDELEAAGWQAIGTGASRAVVQWGQFAYNLTTQPKQTMADLAKTCFETAELLASLSRTIYDITPLHYVDDLADDFQDLIFADTSKVDLPAKRKERDEKRSERNQQNLEHAVTVINNMIKNMQQKPPEDTIADVTQTVVDNILTGKITQGLFHACQIVGDKTLHAAQSFQEMLPADLMHSPMSYIETNAGQIMAIIESTGQSVGDLATAKAAVDRAAKIAENVTRTKDLIDKINAVVQADQKKVAAFYESIKPYLNSEKLINIERLKTLTEIEQIKNFRDYTNNFHPDGIAKLKPEEILYLNLCDWLEKESGTINKALNKRGGITIIDPISQTEVLIEEFDFFHSLLGEMKAGSIRDHTSGGHLMIPELRAAMLYVGEIQHLGNKFIDAGIKYNGKQSISYRPKSYFPFGTSIEDIFNMIEDITKNFQELMIFENENSSIKLNIKNQQNKCLRLNIENNVAKFYPLNPLLFDKK